MNPQIKIFALVVLFCCVAVGSAQMLGGLHDEKVADEEIKKIVTGLKSQIATAAKQQYQSIEPISYRKQIVAGANYFVKALATANDGSKSNIHLRIYKPFKGPLELTAIKTNQEKHKALEYFD